MKTVKITGFIILIIAAWLGFKVWQYYSFLNTPAVSGEAQIFKIETGESARQIADRLRSENFLGNSDYFYYYLRLSGLSARIQAGEYELPPYFTPKQIAEIFAQGQALSREKEIKIIEGWRIRDIDAYLAKQGYRAGAFTDLTASFSAFPDLSASLSFVGELPPDIGMEGFLFPDTYRIFADADTADIISKMLLNFEAKLSPDLRAEIKRQGKTLYEIVTMASLVEKEVRSEKDMKLVSGIFWNRIAVGQALESCATLSYILGVDKAQYTTEDTQIENPYNTYRNPGLPPGPIANPGLKAIEAALYPTPSQYFYFLSRSDNGETVFSKTYEEHLRNKARYLD